MLNSSLLRDLSNFTLYEWATPRTANGVCTAPSWLGLYCYKLRLLLHLQTQALNSKMHNSGGKAGLQIKRIVLNLEWRWGPWWELAQIWGLLCLVLTNLRIVLFHKAVHTIHSQCWLWALSLSEAEKPATPCAPLLMPCHFLYNGAIWWKYCYTCFGVVTKAKSPEPPPHVHKVEGQDPTPLSLYLYTFLLFVEWQFLMERQPIIKLKPLLKIKLNFSCDPSKWMPPQPHDCSRCPDSSSEAGWVF